MDSRVILGKNFRKMEWFLIRGSAKPHEMRRSNADRGNGVQEWIQRRYLWCCGGFIGMAATCVPEPVQDAHEATA
jgi:hypothetical protein